MGGWKRETKIKCESSHQSYTFLPPASRPATDDDDDRQQQQQLALSLLLLLKQLSCAGIISLQRPALNKLAATLGAVQSHFFSRSLALECCCAKLAGEKGPTQSKAALLMSANVTRDGRATD